MIRPPKVLLSHKRGGGHGVYNQDAGFFVASQDCACIEQVAREEQKTNGELLREMWEAHQIIREKREFAVLQPGSLAPVACSGLEI